MARLLLDNLTVEFHPAKYDDTYRKELLALLKEKAESGKISALREEPERGEVVDLVAAARVGRAHEAAAQAQSAREA